MHFQVTVLASVAALLAPVNAQFAQVVTYPGVSGGGCSGDAITDWAVNRHDDERCILTLGAECIRATNYDDASTCWLTTYTNGGCSEGEEVYNINSGSWRTIQEPVGTFRMACER